MSGIKKPREISQIVLSAHSDDLSRISFPLVQFAYSINRTRARHSQLHPRVQRPRPALFALE